MCVYKGGILVGQRLYFDEGSTALAKTARAATLWRQRLFCDMQLRVGNNLLPAHRLLLATM